MKLSHLLLTAVAAVTLSACGNLSNVSKEGTSDNLKWPDIENSGWNHNGSQFGSWPNWDNVRMIEAGMNKDQIRHLIGDPQFAEGLYFVREWDYVFHYRENGVHKICQYKVLFDKDMDAQSFFWYPNGCGSDEIQTYTLTGDFLFAFDRDNLTPKGREVVDNLAEQLKASGAKNINVAGYTDRLGSVAYNLDLSKRRANTVKNRLIAQGVTGDIHAVGYGKANQVKACSGSGQALKDCLQPNRRVEVSASGSVLKQVTQGEVEKVAGPRGPAPLYEK